jgi:hypothetical protein
MKKNNSVNKSKLEALKKEVIEILKNQAEKEYKKALNHFIKEEENYSYLTKSNSGEWIEKAGYEIGRVRIWKGKKYRKVAPGKWVRIYENEGRGTNIAVGKLIAQVKKIDNIEDLMNFALAHKQRFQDKNGMDLPILDKIRAAVDEQNEKLSGESSPYVYGVGENVNTEKNKLFNKKDKITKEEKQIQNQTLKVSKHNYNFTGDSVSEKQRKENLINRKGILINKQEYEGITDKEIRDIAKSKYSNLKPIEKDGIVIEFPMSGFKETKQHSADKKVLYVMEHLDYILKTSVFMYREPNSDRKKTTTLNMMNYANKITIDGVDYFIRIVINEDVNGNFYYDNDSVEFEKVKANIE